MRNPADLDLFTLLPEEAMNAVTSGIRITSHAVGIVVVETQQDGHVYVDRMTYTKGGRTSVRHCMETGEAGESVMDTLESCLHELAKEPVGFAYELVSDEPIFVEFGRDERREGGAHIKVWFAIRAHSPLRDFVLPDGDETLGSISMVEALDLLRETEGRTVRGHVSATRAAVVALGGDRRVLDRYAQIIMGWRFELADDEQAAIDAYPGRW